MKTILKVITCDSNHSNELKKSITGDFKVGDIGARLALEEVGMFVTICFHEHAVA